MLYSLAVRLFFLILNSYPLILHGYITFSEDLFLYLSQNNQNFK